MNNALLNTSTSTINPNDLTFDLGGGPSGPFLRWHAKGTDDGKVPARTFSLYAEGEKEPTDVFEEGVVFDLRHMEVGYQKSTGAKGAAPDWVWSSDKTKLGPRPSKEHTAGFRLPILLPDGRTALWDQASAGANIALQELQNRHIKPAADLHPGKLPKVVMRGTEAKRFGVGGTSYPVLEVVEWVDVPEEFSGGDNPPQPEPAARDELDDVLPEELRA